jgi:hypothetical protein
MEGDGFPSLIQVGDKHSRMDSTADQRWVVVENNNYLWLANTDPNNSCFDYTKFSSCSEGGASWCVLVDDAQRDAEYEYHHLLGLLGGSGHHSPRGTAQKYHGHGPGFGLALGEARLGVLAYCS